MSQGSGKYKFRKHDQIGAASAEQDSRFLEQCFVDNGDIAILEDFQDSRRVIVGRTGAGKTALLRRLRSTNDHVIVIEPESLSLSHIANSGTIRFCLEAGINLDIFYKLLWRHVFTVEILKERHHITNESTKGSFVNRLLGALGKQQDTRKKLALEYLEKFSDKFWQDTEYRIDEITRTLESDIKAGVSATVPNVSFEVGGSKTLTEDQKVQVVHRGQEIVQRIQVRQLNDVLDVLQEDLQSDSRRYFLTIDRLDEGWVDDPIRYRLIRALIDTVREFQRVEQVKIIVAVRTDLLERVFEHTRDAGFQEEKYRSICFPVSWDRQALSKILQSRVNKLIQDAYTKESVELSEILPKATGNTALDYMLDRTLNRPRDLIEFFNACLQRAVGEPKITRSILQEAEAEYSRLRLLALGDEWFGAHPGLIDAVTGLLRGRSHSFRLGDIDDETVSEFCLEFFIKFYEIEGKLVAIAKDVAERKADGSDFRRQLVEILYRIGLLGIKAEGFEKVSWAHASVFSVVPPRITDETRVQVHPTFWRALGITPPPEKRI